MPLRTHLWVLHRDDRAARRQVRISAVVVRTLHGHGRYSRSLQSGRRVFRTAPTGPFRHSRIDLGTRGDPIAQRVPARLGGPLEATRQPGPGRIADDGDRTPTVLTC